MKTINFKVSDDAFRVLELEKSRYGTWKIAVLACFISKLRRSLAYTTFPEVVKRHIQTLQKEAVNNPAPSPLSVSP